MSDKLIPVTLRLQKTLIQELKEIARKQGIGYQPFVRQLLTQHVGKVNNAKR